jgi:flagellar biosynthetic protein FliO
MAPSMPILTILAAALAVEPQQTTGVAPAVITIVSPPETALAERRPVARPPSGPSSVVRSPAALGGTLGPLALVLALIAGSAWAFRRVGRRVSLRAAGSGPIHVVSRQYLSDKQYLCLVRVAGDLLLIGVTPERIAPLCRFDRADEAAGRLGGLVPESSESARPFRRTLARAASAYGSSEGGGETPATGRWSAAATRVRSLAGSIRGYRGAE